MKRPSGSRIAGWWAWWPFTASAHARRFETQEDALNYFPGAGSREGARPPAGDKYVMRVGYGVIGEGPGYGWNYDTPIILSPEQQRDRLLQLLEGELGGDE